MSGAYISQQGQNHKHIQLFIYSVQAADRNKVERHMYIFQLSVPDPITEICRVGLMHVLHA